MDEVKEKQSFADNTVRICVDRYTNQDVAGRMYHRLRDREIPFESLAALLLTTDTLLNDMGKPQSFQQLRTFRREKPRGSTDRPCGEYKGKTVPEEKTQDTFVEQQRGIHTTIDIVIQSRKHATWQGFIRDPSGRFLGTYESELQLMQMLLEQSRKRMEQLS